MQMGKLSNKQCFQHQQPKFLNPSKNRKKPIKITYISSPTMVRAANASEFRAIVQELTGKDSKVLDNWESSINEEACQVSNNCEATPCPKTDSESMDDILSSYTSSSALEMNNDSWIDFPESFFEFQFPGTVGHWIC
ncbi:conserved hypothetical protein [Ricinus communis]|uniref:VQ domain-containing protein n=1 Tax=Ricinus communis TaxID=3988 RepID=B9S7I3_RICCO|nr:conserved hypothetical protein [Ricinus communis]